MTDEIYTRLLTSKGLDRPFWIFLRQDSFQSIQRPIGERWGDNSTLGSSLRCFVKDVLIHIPGFQPLSENGAVHRNVSHEPIVGDFIETASDVTF